MIYIVAIVVIIGLMLLHWAIDFVKQVRVVLAKRPQIRRMTLSEVWQHLFLTVTFVVLVVSGFALRFSESWLTRLLFGWEGGFEWRGHLHRGAAVLFIFTVMWHLVYVMSHRRGRAFVRDIFPVRLDFQQFGRMIMYNLGRRPKPPRFARFSYVEKAEYWALVWGSVVMVVTGLLLWFDNWFIQFLPKGVLDVSLVIHYYEAWLATLAIVVWHLYSTVFSPTVYPMNPSWITGKMPEKMYRHEHPRHIDEAKRETEELLRAELAKLSEDGLDVSEDEHDAGEADDSRKA
jgi:formate dehydrogenase gamma subunit